MKIIKYILFWIVQLTWGLLQTLFGFVLFLKYIGCRREFFNGCILVWHSGKWGGVSLGAFIFVKENATEDWKERSKAHEFGHSIQSAILGPLFFPLIGIPSFLWCNLPFFMRKWRHNNALYHDFWPERNANVIAKSITRLPVPIGVKYDYNTFFNYQPTNQIPFYKNQKFWRLNAYAAGDLMQGSRIVTNTYFAVFLYGVVGMDPFWVGLMFLLVRLLDGISDIIMGMVIDRTRTRWGSCRPFFVLQAPFIFITTILMWSSWGITQPIAQFFYFFFALFLFDTAGSMAWVTYEAYLPKITKTYDERRVHTNVRMIYSGVALVVMIYIFDIIAGGEASRAGVSFEEIFHPDFHQFFTILGVIMGAIFCLPMLIVAFGTKETNSLPTIASEPRTIKFIFNQYKQVLSSKTYRKFFSIRLLESLVISFTTGIVTVMVLLLYGPHDISFNLPILGAVTLMFLAINVSGATEIAFFLPNVIVGKKFSKQSPFFICLPLLILASAIGIFIWVGMPLWIFFLMMVFLGAGRASLGFVRMTLLPDLADVDEMIFGRRREGGAAGLNELGGKAVLGIGSFVVGTILSVYGLNPEYLRGGYAPSAGAIDAIRIIFGVLPILCCIAIIIIAKTYRLDRKRHAIIKKLIAQKHMQGTINPTEQEKIECEKLAGKKWEEMWIGK